MGEQNQRDKRGVAPADCLTVETEAMETQVHMKGVLPWLVRLDCCASTIDFCPALAALVGPVQIIFSSLAHFFTSLVPIAQQAGQAVVPRRQSINMLLVAKYLLINQSDVTCQLETVSLSV